jgi:hypothetical protein
MLIQVNSEINKIMTVRIVWICFAAQTFSFMAVVQESVSFKYYVLLLISSIYIL